jgi:hypothetical protein
MKALCSEMEFSVMEHVFPFENLIERSGLEVVFSKWCALGHVFASRQPWKARPPHKCWARKRVSEIHEFTQTPWGSRPHATPPTSCLSKRVTTCEYITPLEAHEKQRG